MPSFVQAFKCVRYSSTVTNANTQLLETVCWFYVYLMCCLQWRAEVWWCPGRLAWLYAPYQILVLNSGVRWSLLLNIRSLWRHNIATYSRFQASIWRGVLIQHAYYATRTLLTRCCTMCHCNEHNYQRSNLGDQNKIEHSTLRQSSS